MRLENYDEFMEYVVNKFYEEKDIQVICDYDLADSLMCEFGNVDYADYKGVDLQSDVNEYYVTKFGEECFCIEPLKVNNKIKITTSDYFIIDNNILENNPTLLEYLEGDNFEVEIIDYYEECDCKNYYECCNCEEEIDEEDFVYFQLADLIEEYPCTLVTLVMS
ncbi:TPA: hypothetical protein PTV31_003210 [Clostridium botulinum]|nr:hypothetical protein [Clostridium botulinum]